MRVTITSTSQTLKDLLSPEDYGILRAYYSTEGGGLFQNVGINDIYIETGKPATPTDSIAITASGTDNDTLSVGFIRDIFATHFVTSSGNSDLKMIF